MMITMKMDSGDDDNGVDDDKREDFDVISLQRLPSGWNPPESLAGLLV